MKRTTLLSTRALTAAAGMFLLANAQAGIITEWDFQLDSGFTTIVTSGGTGSFETTDVNTFWGAPSTLSWGPTTGNRSGVSLAGPNGDGTYDGHLFTDGAAENTSTFVHTNFAIPAGSDVLVTGTLSDRIVLTPTAPLAYAGAPSLFPPALTFDINFSETPNSLPCAADSPIPCNDIFVIDIVGAGFNPANNTFNQNFFYPDLETPDLTDEIGYNARIFVEGIGILPDQVCDEAGAAVGCIGLTTAEGQVNEFQIYLDITTEQYIPEPATLVLMGLGLAGLGYRRSKSA